MAGEESANLSAAEAEQVNEEAVNTPEDQANSEPTKETKPEVPQWAQRRFSELTRKRYEAEAEAKMLRQENERLRGGTEQAQEPQPLTQQDIDRLVNERAQDLQAQQSFNDRCNEAVSIGESEYKETFAGAVSTLNAMGALFEANGKPTELGDAIMDCETPAAVLNYLGLHPEEAEDLMDLSPKAQARALARIEDKLAQNPAKPVSKAPAPVKPVGQKAASPKKLEELSTADYVKQRNKEIADRRKAR